MKPAHKFLRYSSKILIKTDLSHPATNGKNGLEKGTPKKPYYL
jgi:hypothetical protein